MEAQFITKDVGLTFWLARPQDYDEVALDSALVVDGGHTVVMEGLRVCLSERGKGVAGVIQRVTDSYVKQIYPSVNIKRLTRGDNPPPEKLSKFTVLAQRVILSLRGEAESFNGFVLGLKAKLDTMENTSGPADHKNCLVSVKDSRQLKALLLDPDLSTRLQLPGGAIIQDWQPLKPIESNLKILERRNLTWLANCSDDKPTFMSFHTPVYPIPFNGGSLRFNIDMFGVNLSLARKALIAHLEQEMGEFHDCVLVNIYMPETIWEGMRKFCEGDERVKQCRHCWRQMFLEQEIP